MLTAEIFLDNMVSNLTPKTEFAIVSLPAANLALTSIAFALNHLQVYNGYR